MNCLDHSSDNGSLPRQSAIGPEAATVSLSWVDCDDGSLKATFVKIQTVHWTDNRHQRTENRGYLALRLSSGRSVGLAL